MFQLKNSGRLYVPLDDIELAKYLFFERIIASARDRPDFEVVDFEESGHVGPNKAHFFLFRKDSLPETYFRRRILFRDEPVYHAGKRVEHSFEVDIAAYVGNWRMVSSLDFERDLFGPKHWGWIEDPLDLDDNPCDSSVIHAYCSQKLDNARMARLEEKVDKLRHLLN
ncbi:hypothetical protein KY338_03310 [Candidatus Woesearchaeota archaeon]|nr:hypothetical protein [Candidatus Woesearchaeota archaeon]MBW3005368.1 hypothetical protein [Candidatus Woesearchaeota archaeon]